MDLLPLYLWVLSGLAVWLALIFRSGNKFYEEAVRSGFTLSQSYMVALLVFLGPVGAILLIYGRLRKLMKIKD